MPTTLHETLPSQPPSRFRRVLRGVDTVRLLVLNVVFLLLLTLMLIGLFAFLTRGGAATLKDNTALVLDLQGTIVEQRSGGVGERLRNQARGEPYDQVPLRDILAVLDAAAMEPNISRAVLLLDDFKGAGQAQLHEVAAAMERFKAAGKPIVAWSTNYDQTQYYLAAHATEVLLDPLGAAYAEGFGKVRNYYRDALDRLGVSANVIRVGKYKSFGEPFFANEPSKAAREQDAELYGALWTNWTDDVEKARKLPAGSVAKLIDGLPGNLQAVQGDLAKLALDAHWVDALQTRDQLRDRMIKDGVEDKAQHSFVQISLDQYRQRLKPPATGSAVGVVVAQGEISDAEAGPGAIGGRSTAALVRKARLDDTIKAIVLRVDSPGGSVVGAELIRRELELARADGKPVVVSMGNVAASGGYYISMAADEVIADPDTITGSIGVFAILPTADGLMKKLSIHTEGYGTTWLTNAYDPRRPFDPRLGEVIQAAIRRTYDDFVSKAAAARRTTPEKIDEVAQGRVWTGTQALAHGLVDRTGSYEDALKSAAQRARLADGHYAVRYVEPDRKPIEQLLDMASAVPLQAIGMHPGRGGLPIGALPPIAHDMQRDMQWLADITEGRKPFGGVLHCLCGAP